MVNAISPQDAGPAEEPIPERPMGLSEATQMARDLAEAHRIARLGTWRWVIATDTVTWSEEVYRAFDMDPSLPPPGYAALEETHTVESWARLAPAVHRALSEGEPYEIDVEIVSQLGFRKWIIARGEAAEWADGKVTQLRGTIQDITERKQIELSLREREQELQEVHRIARLGTWRWVRGSDTATWSSEMYEIFGRDPALPAPRMAEIPQFYTPESRARRARAMRRAMEAAKPFELDLEVVRPDGTTRWITVFCLIESVIDGQVERIRGTVQDITDRKQIEMALRERELELQEVHRIARLGTWRWDRLEDTALWSPEVYEIFGLDPALPPPTFEVMQALYTPESRERRAQLVRRALADGRPYAADLEILHPDGTTRWITTRGVIDAPHGEVIGLRGTVQDITERKRAEEAVARSEARYRRVLESITDGLAVLDTDWRYTYFSEQGARMLGVRVEDLVGGCLWELFPQAETTKFGAAYREAVATGKPVHFDEYYPEPLNKWLECHCYPSAEGLSVYFRDTTEQRVAEAAARESQARFQKLYEVNLMGVCFPDRFGAFSEGNDEFLRIVGYSREELAAGLVRWDVMTPPRYAALDAAGIAEALAHGSCTPYEKEYIRKDGTLVPILCGYALLKGSTDEFIGFIMDLTAQKQAERAVQDREQRFSTLADSLPQLIWMSAPDERKIIYVNQPFLDYTGMAPEQAAGFEWRDLVHPDDIGATMKLRAQSIRTGEPYIDNFRIRRHDGMYRSFLSRALPMRNEAGEIERWMGSATDVHDQKLAEDALRRTEKLAATGRLAASIAHEINNPLEAVTNSLYLALQDPTLIEETRFYLKQAEQELTRVAHVTTQTLRFHRQSVAAIDVDLAEVMDSAYGLYAGRFMASRIAVEREYAKGQMLFCRGEEMRQVFSNLVGNALDATRKGGRVRLRIRAGHDGAGVAGMRVTIADTGHGIPAGLQKKIFEPFISTKETTGTGLGLWVSDEIVQKHKGRIVLRSRVEEGEGRGGTVFALFFPADGIKPVVSAGIDDQISPK